MLNNLVHMFSGTQNQLLASLAGTISAISDGMQYGWSAPAVPILQSENTPVKISEGDVSWLETIYLAGSIASLPLTIYLVDKIGRKYSILAANVTCLFAWILLGLARSIEYLYIARFCAGLAGDVSFVAAPMYVAEIADQKVRGFLAGLIYLMMLTGILLIYSVAPFVPFYVPSIIGAGILVIQLLTFSFMPESPYFLVAVGKTEQAKASLSKMGPKHDNDRELKNIEEAIQQERDESVRPQDLVLSKNNRMALIVMTVLNSTQHFCGLTVLLMNLHSILSEAGTIYLESTTSAIIFSVVMLVSATISSLYIDQYGRKVLLTISSILTGICLIVIAVFFTMKHSGMNVDGISWVPIVSVMVYGAVFKFGLGMVPIVMTAELFSPKVKAIGMTIADAVYISSGLLSIQLYQWLDGYGAEVPFYIFGACAFLTAIFSALVVPETRGKSLEEIQVMLKGQNAENK